MRKPLVFLFCCLIALPIIADITKSFQVTNLGATNLIGTVRMMNAGGAFRLSGVTNFNIVNGQTQAIAVTFNTSRIGRFTNWVIFESNGGNSTNLVTGAIIPNAVTNFHFLNAQ